MWWYRAAHARVLDALRRRPGPAGAVLDAGCGTGGFLKRLADQLPGRPAMGLEYDAEATRRAAQKSGFPVVVGDANILPFADASFTAAVSIDVICHAGLDEAKGLAELHRVLAPGGTLVTNLPAYEWMRSAHDARVHTARRYTAGDEFIVEWRALTVALLDELAPLVRAQLGATEDAMPLACVLEGGTWAAGRVLASRLRGGTPPLNIESDGTIL